MRSLSLKIILAAILLSLSGCTYVRPAPPLAPPSLPPYSMESPYGTPFHLKATITERNDPDSKTEVEIKWYSPTLWERTISSSDFSQKLRMNETVVFEDDSDDYFPDWLHLLTEGMVDPDNVKDLRQSRDFTYGHRLNMSVQEFNGHEAPQSMMYIMDTGDAYRATVTELTRLDEPPNIALQPITPDIKLIRFTKAEQTELQPVGKHEIIWPQALDGPETGEASFYLSIDRKGQVREVLPLRTANERTNDSARRQIAQWKFKPVLRGGVPVQVDAMMTFQLNTRKWGPKEPLTGKQTRKLALNIPDGGLTPGSVPKDKAFLCRVAVDTDGQLIEMIANGGVRGMKDPCMTYKVWKFRPLKKHGKAVPYRGVVEFAAP